MAQNHSEAFWWEPAQGMIRKYFINGQEQKLYLIDTKLSKQYAGFRLILKDLKTVKQIISELKSSTHENSHIIRQSLTFYAVITYGKCFSEAKGRGVSLNRKDALQYATNEETMEHDQLIHLRNQYVAHSGQGGYEHNPVVAALNSLESNPEIIEIYDNIMVLVNIDTHLDIFSDIVDKVFKYVEEKTIKLKAKMANDLGNEDLSKLYGDAIDYSDVKSVNIKVDKK